MLWAESRSKITKDSHTHQQPLNPSIPYETRTTPTMAANTRVSEKHRPSAFLVCFIQVPFLFRRMFSSQCACCSWLILTRTVVSNPSWNWLSDWLWVQITCDKALDKHKLRKGEMHPSCAAHKPFARQKDLWHCLSESLHINSRTAGWAVRPSPLPFGQTLPRWFRWTHVPQRQVTSTTV